MPSRWRIWCFTTQITRGKSGSYRNCIGSTIKRPRRSCNVRLFAKTAISVGDRATSTVFCNQFVAGLRKRLRTSDLAWQGHASLSASRDAKFRQVPWERPSGRERRSGGEEIYETHLKPREMFIKPAASSQWDSDRERVSSRRPYVSWAYSSRHNNAGGCQATRFRGRDGGQCATPAAAREERRPVDREEERETRER